MLRYRDHEESKLPHEADREGRASRARDEVEWNKFQADAVEWEGQGTRRIDKDDDVRGQAEKARHRNKKRMATKTNCRTRPTETPGRRRLLEVVPLWSHQSLLARTCGGFIARVHAHMEGPAAARDREKETGHFELQD